MPDHLFQMAALKHLAPDADPHAAAKWKRKPPSPALFNSKGQDYRRRALCAEWALFYWMIGGAVTLAVFMSKHSPSMI
jgi:hypothetical protein